MTVPSISVVVPAFNAEATIAATIGSVLRQTDPADELLVVDDGSNDATADVIRQFGDRLTLISQTNQGVSVARQVATDRARSEYVAYLDADDIWPNDRLKTARRILLAQEVHCMLADLRRAPPGADPQEYGLRNSSFYPHLVRYLEGHSVPSPDGPLYHLPQPHALEWLLGGFPVYPSTMIVRRTIVPEVGGWDARFTRTQDFDLALRIAQRYPLHYQDTVEAILGLHPVNSDETGYILMQTEGDLQVLRTHLEEFEAPDYREAVARTLGRRHAGLGFTLRKLGRYREAAGHYRFAMEYPGQQLHSGTRWMWCKTVCALRARPDRPGSV